MEIYEAIYNAHERVFKAIIKSCGHEPTIKLLKSQRRSDRKFIDKYGK